MGDRNQCLWFKEGDRNTKYFERVSNIHRKYDCIDRLKVGEITINDKVQVKEVVPDFY